MATRHSEEFKRDAVRIALTSGLTRKQISSDLGVGISVLNKWISVPLHMKTDNVFKLCTSIFKLSLPFTMANHHRYLRFDGFEVGTFLLVGPW